MIDNKDLKAILGDKIFNLGFNNAWDNALNKINNSKKSEGITSKPLNNTYSISIAIPRDKKLKEIAKQVINGEKCSKEEQNYFNELNSKTQLEKQLKEISFAYSNIEHQKILADKNVFIITMREEDYKANSRFIAYGLYERENLEINDGNKLQASSQINQNKSPVSLKTDSIKKNQAINTGKFISNRQSFWNTQNIFDSPKNQQQQHASYEKEMKNAIEMKEYSLKKYS